MSYENEMRQLFEDYRDGRISSEQEYLRRKAELLKHDKNNSQPSPKPDDNSHKKEEKTHRNFFSKKTNIVILLITFILIFFIGSGGYYFYQKAEREKIEQERIIADEKVRQIDEVKKFNEYVDNLKHIQTLMLTGGEICENISGMVGKVWQNCILEKRDYKTDDYTRDRERGYGYVDFNKAISNYYKDKETKSMVDTLKNNNYLVAESLRKLQNPPAGCENSYSAITTLYKTYTTLSGIAISPSGNLQAYTNNRSVAISEFISLNNQLNVLIPGKRKLSD